MSKKFPVAETLLYAAILILGTLLLARIDAFESLYAFSRAHENWDLDDIILIIPVGAVCLALFSFNRSRELLAKSRQLEQARNDLAEVHDKLVEVIRTREEFIAVSCHELKNPLNGIIYSLELLGMAENEQDREEGFAYAKAAAKGLAILIDGVLELSSLTNNGYQNLKEFSPHELLRSIRTLAQLQADAKGLELRTVMGEDVPQSVVGHEAGLRLSILNLVGNAIKYTESGSVLINVSCNREDHHWELIATVTDTGTGIPNDKLKFIFEPYRKLGDTDKPGVGLGLAIVNRIMDKIGGTISVSSNVGHGSEFTLKIPVNPA